MREYPASTVAKAITEVSSDEASKLAVIFLDQPEASQSIQDLLALQFHFGEVEDSAQ